MMQVRGTTVLTDPAELARRLEHEDIIAYDCETTGLSPYRDKIALMQFYGDKTGTLGVIPIREGFIPPAVREIFRPGPLFIAHNGVNFDLQFLLSHGIDWVGTQWYDTLVGETVVAATNKRNVRVNLKDSARRRLGIEVDKTVEHSWQNAELTERQIEYAATDVMLLPPLYRSQLQVAEDTKQLDALKMEQEVMPVFARMTYNGMPVMPHILREYVGAERVKAEQLKREICEVLGDINLNSTKQLKDAFRDRLGVNMISTAADTLQDMSQLGLKGGDIAGKLLYYRHANQRVKMYSEEWINSHITNNRVHPRFWQCSTDTGRVSCSDPNLQQVPRDGRKIFGNLDGWTMVAADYSQIEVRVAAWVAKDQKLISMLDEEDIHTAVAASMFNKRPENVTKEERKLSKACSFTLLFGGGANRLHDYARRNGSDVSLNYMKEVVAKFFLTFEGIRQMKQRAAKWAEQDGPVVIRMPNGFRRILTGQEKTLTRILNTSVQGSAAVGLKYALIEADRQGLTRYLSATVHDEIVACVPDNEAEEYGKELVMCMTAGMKRFLTTSVKAELKVGKSWIS